MSELDFVFEVRIPGLLNPKQSVRFRTFEVGERVEVDVGRRTRIVGERTQVQAYQPSRVTNYQVFVRNCAARVVDRMQHSSFDGPLQLTMIAWLPRPASRKANKYPWPDRKPDLENIEKPIIDALEQAAVMVNDSRICRKVVEKRYVPNGNVPGVVVRVQLLREGPADGEGFEQRESHQEEGEQEEVHEEGRRLKKAPRTNLE